MKAVTFFDGTAWHEGTVDIVDGAIVLRGDAPRSGAPRLDGVITGGFTDHHVHLQLVDSSLLASSALGRVVDLGGNPAVIADLAVDNSGRTRRGPRRGGSAGDFDGDVPELSTPARGHRIRVEYAGAFLTAPGGYPSDRSWAPAASWREIADPGEAAAAVAEMADAGASCIKVASNSTAGPVFGDELFRVIAGLAAARGLPVVAHAEGRGEAQRVARLGARMLAHAPFTERLTDDEIEAQAASLSWISTLAIHAAEELGIATDNVRRFHAAGGIVRYGTDMGNGPTPVDVNPVEVTALRDAGIDGDALLRALSPVDPREPGSQLLRFPPGSGADPLRGRPLTIADLEN
ncbi:hydrolase [Microbacterium sp.]|uniref:hydrolase n=1 Tax=Microbacterium sp. TaxID=51671 RepID=UPI0028114D8F|nr:hydrolase [Microbacterium sp.]